MNGFAYEHEEDLSHQDPLRALKKWILAGGSFCDPFQEDNNDDDVDSEGSSQAELQTPVASPISIASTITPTRMVESADNAVETHLVLPRNPNSDETPEEDLLLLFRGIFGKKKNQNHGDHDDGDATPITRHDIYREQSKTDSPSSIISITDTKDPGTSGLVEDHTKNLQDADPIIESRESNQRPGERAFKFKSHATSDTTPEDTSSSTTTSSLLSFATSQMGGRKKNKSRASSNTAQQAARKVAESTPPTGTPPKGEKPVPPTNDVPTVTSSPAPSTCGTIMMYLLFWTLAFFVTLFLQPNSGYDLEWLGTKSTETKARLELESAECGAYFGGKTGTSCSVEKAKTYVEEQSTECFAYMHGKADTTCVAERAKKEGIRNKERFESFLTETGKSIRSEQDRCNAFLSGDVNSGCSLEKPYDLLVQGKDWTTSKATQFKDGVNEQVQACQNFAGGSSDTGCLVERAKNSAYDQATSTQEWVVATANSLQTRAIKEQSSCQDFLAGKTDTECTLEYIQSGVKARAEWAAAQMGDEKARKDYKLKQKAATFFDDMEPVPEHKINYKKAKRNNRAPKQPSEETSTSTAEEKPPVKTQSQADSATEKQASEPEVTKEPEPVQSLSDETASEQGSMVEDESPTEVVEEKAPETPPVEEPKELVEDVEESSGEVEEEVVEETMDDEPVQTQAEVEETPIDEIEDKDLPTSDEETGEFGDSETSEEFTTEEEKAQEDSKGNSQLDSSKVQKVEESIEELDVSVTDDIVLERGNSLGNVTMGTNTTSADERIMRFVRLEYDDHGTPYLVRVDKELIPAV